MANPKKSSRPSKAISTPKDDPEVKTPTEPTNRPKSLTVVGIGASAGGLKALAAFFDALPSDIGMAFVVITHLHPEYESHLAELLQKHTLMTTTQVTNRVKVQPNHVYVIPPNRSISMTDSHLDTAEFEEPHGQRTPVDHFFRSLAQGHSDSIAVVLSGGGTDGSVGIKDIKENGGLILVQHPDDAEYDSMPRAVISTGLADIILPANQLAEKLVEYTRHRPQLPHDAGQLSEPELETLQRILAQVHARTGHDFNQYKRSTILRRVERRMQLNGFITLEAYLNYLRHNANEAQAMFNDILIGVTNFFRDRDSWATLEERVIPQLFKHKDEGQEIRVWSIGCATGEEAYSLAILLFEYANQLDFRPHIQIFASDLDEGSITHARNGLYPAAIEADVSATRLERFFNREGEYYRVKREIRDAVLFTNHNILRDPPFSRQDLIACRNVLIYLQRTVQDRLFDIFHYALNPESFLFLGSSESAEHLPELFNVLDKNHRIYQARPWIGERPHVPSMPMMLRRGIRPVENEAGIRTPTARFVDDSLLIEEQHQRALENYGPPTILVNERYQILHVSDTAGRYLHQPKGPITGDIMKLVRHELQLELRAALFQAFEKEKASISRSVAVQFNGHPHRVVISVRPRTSPTEDERGAEKRALVVFLEDEADTPMEGTDVHAPHDQAERDKLVAQLESEVQRLREQLQITIEEYDSSNEEMKAANEELQSINEEYRSATEELETSKEELQSVNEELQTVNSEMRNKLEEVSRAHQELENLLGATEIPTLYLDRELKIQRYTAGIQQLFNIMPVDRGRPISHLTHRLLNYDDLMHDAEQVIRKLSMIEREVQIKSEDSEPAESAYLIRLRPYRTKEDRIEGVVITFMDVTPLKAIEQELLKTKQMLEDLVEVRTRELADANQKRSQARNLFETLFDTSPVPTSITTLEEGIFINVNAAYLEYYGLKTADVIGRRTSELSLPIAQNLRAPLIAQLQKDGPIRNIEMETRLPSGEVRTIHASVQIVQADNKNALMLAFIDITERVRTERDVRTAATSLSAAEQLERRRISQILHDDLQQDIFAVKVQLTFLAEALARNDPESAKTDLKQIDEWLAEAIAQTRQLSIDLSPPILSEEGLAESLLWLASQAKTQYGLEVTVEASGLRATLDDDVRALVLQSIRELLFNVVKHAGVLNASIHVASFNNQVTLTVSDDGKGFDPQVLQNGKSHGLKKMRDRLFLVGCTLKIDSGGERGGSRITIEAPAADQVT